MHSGDNSRPTNYKIKEYKYLLKRKELGSKYLILKKKLNII